MIPRLKPALGWRELIATALPAKKSAVTDFENQFAITMNQKHAVAFPYGRTGLMLLLQSLRLQDKEIICPAYTCVVVAHAIVKSGNKPVFVDSQDSDFNMNLELAEESISENTGAIIVTSIFGYPVDLDKLADIKRKYPHVKIIQDCAHSFGAEWQGRPVQRFGDAAFFGLNVSKMITSVFGGMVTTDDEELADSLRELKAKCLQRAGWRKSFFRRIYLTAAFIAFSRLFYGLINWLERKQFLNRFVRYYDESKITMPRDYLSDMTSYEAAIGLVQLKKYFKIIKARRDTARLYMEALQQVDGLTLPPLVDGATYSHFVLRVKNREGLIKYALSQGVQLGNLIEYSIPCMPVYKFSDSQQFHVSLAMADSVVNLPVWYGVDVGRVVKLISLYHGVASEHQ